jgi:hypothetical protein
MCGLHVCRRKTNLAMHMRGMAMGQDGMGLDRPDQGDGHERDGNETGLDRPD